MAGTARNRYRSAAELAAEIEAVLADEPVKAWREPLMVRTARWVRRNRTWVATGAATASVLLVALAAIAVLQNAANTKLVAANFRETAAA